MEELEAGNNAALPDELAQDAQANAAQSEQTQAGPLAAGDDNEQETDEGEEDRPKRLSGSQRLKRRLSFVQAENQELHRRLEQVERGGASRHAPEADNAPRQEDFAGDYLSYQQAKVAHEARAAVRDEFRRLEETQAAERDMESRRDALMSHVERVEDARTRIPDFDDVMGRMRGVNVRNDVIEEIISSDKGALIAYHLANHPEKLRELNGMTSRELVREIGRLEGGVSYPASRRRTNTPAPPSQIRGGANRVRDPSVMSMKEYEAWRMRGA